MTNRTLASFILAATTVSSSLAFAEHATYSPVRHPQAYFSAPASSLTREQVSQETLEARRNGTLQAAGEGAEAAFRLPAASTMTRAYVQFDANSARARGELVPAGEAQEPLNVRATGPSKTRAEVRHETQTARMNGTLLPAGDAANFWD